MSGCEDGEHKFIGRSALCSLCRARKPRKPKPEPCPDCGGAPEPDGRELVPLRAGPEDTAEVVGQDWCEHPCHDPGPCGECDECLEGIRCRELEPEDDGDDDYDDADPREEALTDAERNPSLGGLDDPGRYR